MDFRQKENRKEAFIQWYAWSLQYKDCDPSVWLTNYLNSRYEHNTEQRYWFCWLYGNTYQLPTAWVLMNEFPDFELASYDRINVWNKDNYKRLRYQTDTKWNKGHLPDMFASYQKFIGSSDQHTKFQSLLGDNEHQSFENVFGAVKEDLYKFGRYSSWFYTQHLKHTTGLPIEPNSLVLDDYSGSKSHRNGLLYALGMEHNIDQKLTKVEYASLESKASEIIEEMKSRFPHLTSELDFYTMETCLCSFKKLFRTHHGRYLGYYLDRQAEEIIQAELDGWAGIQWNVAWQARSETIDHRLDNKLRIQKELFESFLATGSMIRSDWMFESDTKVHESLEDLF